jgi:phospholipid transport system substrate-binding protein
MRSFGSLLVAVLGLMWSLTASAAGDPESLVRDTAEQVLAQIDARRAELEQDSSSIFDLVRNQVIVHFDFERMTQLAAGRYWRDADPVQQQRLIAEFQELLIRTYATALLSYSGDPIEYTGTRVDQERDRALVSTRVSNGAGPKIPIDYRLYTSAGQWFVYDVVIDGVSLLTSYRSSFSQEARRGGIEGLIGSLSRQNDKLRG